MEPAATPPLLEQHREALAGLCRRFGVARLDVFGSAARGGFVPGESDVDFVDPASPGIADRYFDLAEALESLLGCPVDLVTERSLRNPILRERIARERLLLYAA